MNWKDFFYFSQKERRGILILLAFIAGIVVAKWLSDTPKPNEQPIVETLAATDSAAPTTAYVPLYEEKPNPQRPRPKTYHQPEKRTYYRQDREPKRPSEPEKRTYYRPDKPQAGDASPESSRPQKLSAGETLELNTADSLSLIRIPGIGNFFARSIIRYRDRLGGYHCVEQLQEVYGMYEELYTRIAPFLEVDKTQITGILVNQASVPQLKSHPYINFYQAKALVDTRKAKGGLTGINELQLLEEFTEEDWARITPYLVF